MEITVIILAAVVLVALAALVVCLRRMSAMNAEKAAAAEEKAALANENAVLASRLKSQEETFRALEEHGIRLIDETQLNDEQQAYLKTYYHERLNGYTNPIWFSEIDEVGQLEDNRIYLLVKRTEPSDGLRLPKSSLALIKVPDREHGRFVKLPPSDGFDNIMYLDDVVRYCLPLIFIGFKPGTFEAYSFKFTKDAEMEMENDFEYGVLQKIAKGVRSRRLGVPVRLICLRT